MFACFYTHDIIRDARETPISRKFYRLTQKGIQIAPKPLIYSESIASVVFCRGAGFLDYIFSSSTRIISQVFFFQFIGQRLLEITPSLYSSHHGAHQSNQRSQGKPLLR